MTSDPLTRYLTQRAAKMDRRNRLRIMSSGEIIDAAVRVYQVLGRSFLRVAFLPSLFCLAAVTFLFRYVLPGYAVTQSPGSESAQLGEVALNTGLALFVAAPLFLLGLSYATAAITHLVSDYMVGNAPSVLAASLKARSLVWKLALLNLRTILMSIAGFIGALALLALAGHLGTVTSENDATAAIVLIIAWCGLILAFVPFLMVLQSSAVAGPVLVLEGVGIRAAVKRSNALLKRSGPHPHGGNAMWLLYIVLGLLLAFVAGGLSSTLDMIGYPDNVRHAMAGMPFAAVILQALGLLPTFLVLWTLIPVWAATLTIIYYDRRIRLEGYDIEALAEDVWRADRSRRFEL